MLTLHPDQQVEPPVSASGLPSGGPAALTAGSWLSWLPEEPAHPRGSWEGPIHRQRVATLPGRLRQEVALCWEENTKGASLSIAFQGGLEGNP